MKIIKFVWQWLARRRVGIGLFVALWLVVLCVPSLRLLLRTQVLGSSLWSWRGGISFSLYPDDLSIARLEEQFPNDWRVQVARLEEDDNSGMAIMAPPMPPRIASGKAATKPFSVEDSVAAQYDKLIARHPQKAWLLALHLHSNLNTLEVDNNGAIVASSRFSVRELQHAISVAERGRKLEPQNAFFDAALFTLLLASRRDEAALRVLDQASRKTTYDDHELDRVQNSIAARELVRPLVLEEKRNLTSHFYDIRRRTQYAFGELDQTLGRTAGLVAALMRKAELQENHARAIKVRSDLARLLALAMQGRTNRSSAKGLVAPLVTAWSGKSSRVLDKRLPRSLRAGTPERERARVQLAAQLFANYARRHGQASIAQETFRLGNQALRLMNLTGNVGHNDHPGLPAQLVARIDALEVLGAFSLLQLAGLAGACCLFSCVVLPMSRPEVQPHDVRNSTRATVLLSVLLAVGALPAAMLLSRTSYGVSAPPHLQFVAIVSIMTWLLSPFIAGALFVWAATVRRVWKRKEAVRLEPPRFDDESARHFNPPDHLESAMTLCTSLTVIVALGCWCASLIAYILKSRSWTLPFTLSPLDTPYTIWDPATWFVICAIFLSLAIYVGWIVKWRWFAPLAMRPLLHGALRWYRQTLSVFMIMSSVFYLLSSLASVGPRREAEAHLNHYLKHGDVTSLRAK